MGLGTASAGRALVAAALLLAAELAVVLCALAPPRPQPAAAPAAEFSAARALASLRRVLPEEVPHPVGSAANSRVRERLLAELRRLGYAPEVQRTFSCGRYGACGEVENVAARLEGERAGKAVLLLTHYDSVPAGPGAADDGAGVAALLEVARALREGPRPPRPVIFLADDGEEGGLLGAAAFLGEHPWAREVGAVVNLEARGTSGPSLMFETGEGDRWLARRLARALRRPVTSSLFASVYRLLPSDTDLSVFLPGRLPALNFAFIGEASRYHTPLDDLAHLDPRSLQHQGENALAMVRSLAAADLERPPPGDAVFFDLFGRGVVSWPVEAAWPLAAAALLLAAGAAWGARRGGLTAGRVSLGVLGTALAPALGAAVALALWAGLSAVRGWPEQWLAHPLPARAAFWTAGLLAPALLGAVLAQRAGPGGLRSGQALVWALASLALAGLLPGASHLAVVPGLAAALVALPWSGPVAAWLGVGAALVNGALLLPTAILLGDAAGLWAGPAEAAALALAALPLVPLAAELPSRLRWRLVLLPAAAAAASAAWAAALPASSPERPAHLVIFFHQDADRGTARWLAYSETGRLPAALRAVAGFSPRATPPFGWAGLRPAFSAEARPIDEPGPELTVLERSADGARRRLRARLLSPRGAPDAYLLFPPGARVVSVAMAGRPVPVPPARVLGWYGGWRMARCLTLPPAGVEVELVLEGMEPVEVQLVDQRPGLPPGGERLAAARPAWAATFQEGDTTYVTRWLKL